ncbi:MAG: hypothetical protein ACR2PQ_13360 [Myxococcota bacterium]
MRTLSQFLSLCVLCGLLSASAGHTEDKVRFELCGRKLASVELAQFEGPQPWGVLIQLSEADAEAFRVATAEHPGAILEITHGARIVVSGQISGEIRTGLITATYEKKEDAESSRKALRDEDSPACKDAT